MRMIFTEVCKVTIMNSKKEYKDVNRQSIADYCTECIVTNCKTVLNQMCDNGINDISEIPYPDNTVRRSEVEHKTLEATILMTYLPFIVTISLISEQTIVIMMYNLDEPIDVKLQVSKELYDFLNEL